MRYYSITLVCYNFSRLYQGYGDKGQRTRDSFHSAGKQPHVTEETSHFVVIKPQPY